MELRITVDGVERSVSGITDSTTCAQIIYALAHATGQKGRFVLIEKFRNTERSLAPLDRPLEMLRKWGTHSRSVTFMLKHLDEGSLSVTGDAYAVGADDQEDFQLEGPSFSALNTQIAQNTEIFSADDCDEHRGATSSAVAAPMMKDHLYAGVQKVSPQTTSAERLKNRPPPPAYHKVIEQRFTSMSRESNTPSGSLTPLHSAGNSTDDQWYTSSVPTPPLLNSDNTTVLTKKMSVSALEDIIQSQKQIIEQQKTYLAQLDIAVDDDQQREVIQLERQQENLRAVLNPLRECDWPNRLQRERTELQKIASSISDFKEKLDTITSEVRQRTEEEQKLRDGILAMEKELKQFEDEIESADLSDEIY